MIIPLLIALILPLGAYAAENPSLKTLYNSLDPLSISQHLAFYELYPDTPYGDKALKKSWELLNQEKNISSIPEWTLPKFDVQAIISLVTRQSFDPPVTLTEEQLTVIEKLGEKLGNRKLKGHQAWTEQELIALPSEEIDLGRALLISQSPDAKHAARQYEASLDLMALQIRVRLSNHATHEEKIREISRFIFQEMQFRFPPHSLYAKDIDLYTFLPSVLDSRQGVCLGVSILYLALAQRLELPLEIITPPGHIYVRYVKDGQETNIETTARGIHLPSETYLGIDTRSLQKRTMKEVIGLAFINQASVFWSKGDFATTVSLYEKARPYLQDDQLLKLFLGLNYLFTGKKAEGKKLLEEIRKLTFDYAVSPETIPEDYLNRKVDAEGIKVIFLPVDETRASIIEKQKKLEKVLKRYPQFRAGILQLAITWLQLGRGSEALEVLEKHHAIDPNNSVVEYYLAVLCLQRYDYLRAWKFLRSTEAILASRDHAPKALKGVKSTLKTKAKD